jgi:hypothetical protein
MLRDHPSYSALTFTCGSTRLLPVVFPDVFGRYPLHAIDLDLDVAASGKRVGNLKHIANVS